jgi:hypothetical protein
VAWPLNPGGEWRAGTSYFRGNIGAPAALLKEDRMSPEKQRVLEMIEALPDESTVDDILEELHFRLQVDKGLEELDSGKGIPHEQVRSTLSRWLER